MARSTVPFSLLSPDDIRIHLFERMNERRRNVMESMVKNII